MPDQRCDKTSQLVLWYRDFLEKGKSAAFVSCVATRYSVMTLERMATSTNHEVRRAAVLALGMIGSSRTSLPVVSRCLQDNDRCVRLLAEIAFADLARRQMGTSGAQILDAIRRHIDGHRYRHAASMLEEVTQTWPQFADAWYLRGLVSYCLGQYARSTGFTRRAAEINLHHFPAYTLEARCWMELDRNEVALRCFEKSFWINPSQLVVKGYIDTLRRQLRMNDSA